MGRPWNLLNVGARFLPMKPLAGRIQTDPGPQLRHEADPTMVETHGVQTPPSWLFHRACTHHAAASRTPYLGASDATIVPMSYV
jgi:hypothetical protein